MTDRDQRNRLKRQVKNGELQFVDVLDEPTIQSIEISTLVEFLPGAGSVSAAWICSIAAVKPNRLVGDLTEPQWERVRAAVESWVSPDRIGRMGLQLIPRVAVTFGYLRYGRDSESGCLVCAKRFHEGEEVWHLPDLPGSFLTLLCGEHKSTPVVWERDQWIAV